MEMHGIAEKLKRIKSTRFELREMGQKVRVPEKGVSLLTCCQDKDLRVAEDCWKKINTQ